MPQQVRRHERSASWRTTCCAAQHERQLVRPELEDAAQFAAFLHQAAFERDAVRERFDANVVFLLHDEVDRQLRPRLADDDERCRCSGACVVFERQRDVARITRQLELAATFIDDDVRKRRALDAEARKDDRTGPCAARVLREVDDERQRPRRDVDAALPAPGRRRRCCERERRDPCCAEEYDSSHSRLQRLLAGNGVRRSYAGRRTRAVIATKRPG